MAFSGLADIVMLQQNMTVEKESMKIADGYHQVLQLTSRAQDAHGTAVKSRAYLTRVLVLMIKLRLGCSQPSIPREDKAS